ncbi:hypothetical protein BGZ51_003447 [Haplosporangium sp. Z 767]|nr:hypothetical protein BGZ50_001869 [Haplosporangium sp. Z 11]KAF9193396.1 hypothetical protein BGZ51_003447 [Haplosporangium sp. Z 767]
MPQLGYIPEILHQIAPYLNTHDYVCCVQVSQLWHLVFTEYLWNKIDDSRRPWRRLLGHFCEPVDTYFYSQQQTARQLERVPDTLVSLFAKYGHHIKRLSIRRPQTLHACLLAGLWTQDPNKMASLGLSPGRSTTAGVGTGMLLPCRNLISLRVDFLYPVVKLIETLDHGDDELSPALSALSATMEQQYQQELTGALADIPATLFCKEYSCAPQKEFFRTLVRAVWQLAFNNPNLRDLRLGQFYTVALDGPLACEFIYGLLAARPELRTFMTNLQETKNFLGLLPRMLPRLEKLWFVDGLTLPLDTTMLLAQSYQNEGDRGRAEEMDGKEGEQDGGEDRDDARAEEIDVHKLATLKILRIHGTIMANHLKPILYTFPNLETLKLATITHNNDSQTDQDPDPLMTHSGIREIELSIGEGIVVPNIQFTKATSLVIQKFQGTYRLHSLLRCFPQLDRLSIHKQDRSFADSFMDHLQGPAYPIRILRLEQGVMARNNQLEAFLAVAPHLTEVYLWKVTAEALTTMAARCPLLQVLEFHEKVDTSMHGLGALLSSCPDLRVCIGPNLMISVKDLVTQTWVCQGLQRLSCVLTDMSPLLLERDLRFEELLQSFLSMAPANSFGMEAVDRFIDSWTELERKQWGEYAEPLRKLEQRRELERAAFRYLSQFDQLEVLDFGVHTDAYYNVMSVPITLLGQEIKYRTCDQFSLEMTLQSGLGYLSTLRSLKAFGFAHVNHRMGETEVEWMKKHWPNLTTIIAHPVEVMTGGTGIQ